jgi:hypothetical protein
MDVDCGSGAHCGFKDDAGNGYCLKSCAGNGECRGPAYECYDFDIDGAAVKECEPVGSGAGAVGDPCTSNASCANGQNATCLTQERYSFKNGYCSKFCTSNAQCPVGSHCTSGGCAKDCASDGQCRGNGYACEDADGNTVKECWATSNGPGVVGAPCAGPWDCGGGTFGACVTGASWPGGYCTILCGASQGSCTVGSDCAPLPGATSNLVCLDTCGNVNECRVGYECSNAGGNATLECVP